MQTAIPDGSNADRDFDDARLRAMLGTFADWLTLRSHELVPFDAVLERVQIRGQHMLGLQTVPLDRIVGSEGRANDFDRNFMPLTQRTKDRWKRIMAAHRAGVPLPPIELLKVGDVYFVRDGNHRVSVARRLGQHDIDAYVAELTTDTPLEPGLTTRDLPYVEEQSDFMEWTGLARVPTATPIRVSRLGDYLYLIAHINRHRAQLECAGGGAISRDAAVADWYTTVYEPIIRLLRQAGIAVRARRTAEGDLFLRVLRHQDELARSGLSFTLQQAAEDLIASQRSSAPWRDRHALGAR